jgi:hypothetical protein
MTHPESVIQRDIVTSLSMAGVFVFSIPNEAGGKSSAVRMGRLVAMGLRAGASDLVLLGPGGVCVFLEVKTKTGKQSPSQLRFQAMVEKLGFHYRIVRSAAEALDVARERGLVGQAKGYRCRCGAVFNVSLGKYGCPNCCGDSSPATIV